MDLKPLIEKQAELVDVLQGKALKFAGLSDAHNARDFTASVAVAVDKLMTLKANEEFQPNPVHIKHWVEQHPDLAAEALRAAGITP